MNNKLLLSAKLFSIVMQVSLLGQQAMAQGRQKADAFCTNNGYMFTEAYIESQGYVSAVCSNMLTDSEISCYVPEKYFIVVKSLADNKISALPTWPKISVNRYPYVYTFESTLNGINYQIKTTGGSNNYNPNDRFWTSILLKKDGKVIHSNKINNYFGNIGMGC